MNNQFLPFWFHNTFHRPLISTPHQTKAFSKGYLNGFTAPIHFKFFGPQSTLVQVVRVKTRKVLGIRLTLNECIIRPQWDTTTSFTGVDSQYFQWSIEASLSTVLHRPMTTQPEVTRLKGRGVSIQGICSGRPVLQEAEQCAHVQVCRTRKCTRST